MEVVSIASNGQEALNETIVHCPNVGVLDVSMPILDEMEAAKQISSKCLNPRE
jgi:chemotaxis response regulator CheB